MELQLGLALPTSIPINMFDLNSYVYEPKQEAFSSNCMVRPLLKLGSCEINNSNSSSSSSSSGGGGGRGGGSRKRGFEESRGVPKTLPLLLWNNQPNDEDDDPKDLEDNSSSAIFKNDEGLVGWPPVNTWRKKLRRQIIPDGVAQNNRVVAAAVAVADNVCNFRASNSTYVKVKMEGVPIARKIDLSVHQSFETLKTTLMRMFGIHDGWKNFKLTYQDREGDWLLAEDVPWRTFIRSLKCLKLIRIRA